jgi:hypothetical protein
MCAMKIILAGVVSPQSYTPGRCHFATACLSVPLCLLTFRENAEAIAFYGGDVREASDLSSRLTVVLDVLLRRTAWLGGYELWLVVYRWVRLCNITFVQTATWPRLGASPLAQSAICKERRKRWPCLT